MININLLPENIKSEIRASKKNRFLFSFFIILTFAFLASGFLVYMKIGQVKIKIDKVDKEISEYTLELQDSQKTIEEFTNLKEKASIFSEIKLKQNEWDKVLEDIQDKTPSRLYLSSVTFNKDGGGASEIKGIAESRITVASFVDSMSESPRFSDLKIEELLKVTDPAVSAEAYGFTLKFVLNEVPK